MRGVWPFIWKMNGHLTPVRNAMASPTLIEDGNGIDVRHGIILVLVFVFALRLRWLSDRTMASWAA